jgi:hypothetical protein
MSKYPIWARDYKGKWGLFPYQLLTTFPDGKVGFVFEKGHDHCQYNGQYNVYWQMLMKYGDHFTFDGLLTYGKIIYLKNLQ